MACQNDISHTTIKGGKEAGLNLHNKIVEADDRAEWHRFILRTSYVCRASTTVVQVLKNESIFAIPEQKSTHSVLCVAFALQT